MKVLMLDPSKTKKLCEPIVDKKYAYLTHKHGWCTNNGGYAVATINYELVLMHRLIMELELGRKLTEKEIVDHRDFDTMNNRVRNLRVTNNAGNQQHLNPSKFPFRGVHKNSRGRKYTARVKYRGKIIHLGSYSTIQEAEIIAEIKREQLGFLK